MSVTPSRLVMVTATLLIWPAGCGAPEPDPITDARSAGGLAYDLAGAGPFVVLIHGSNLDRRMWDGEVTWLQEHHRVLRYDLRGQGASDEPTEAYSNHADLLALLDELGETEVSLVGISAGAQVAADVALQAPDRVSRLVLISPSLAGYVPERMPPFFADLGAALRASDYRRANEVLLASPVMSVPPRFEERVREMVDDNSRLWTIPYSMVQQASPPAIERLESLETPMLVLVGDEDLEAIRAQGLLLEQRCPRARRVTIPGGGHLLNMTSPEAVRRAMSTFLAAPQD